jgi:hypothetical protein
VWNRDASNRARIIVKIRVPDMLEIPISHVLISVKILMTVVMDTLGRSSIISCKLI